MTNAISEFKSFATLTLCLVCIGLITAGLTGIVAAETPDGPDLQCIGTGDGVTYVTDSGLRIHENHTAEINQFYFPSSNTALFNYSTGSVNLSGNFASAQLEEVTQSSFCLGSVRATDGSLTAQANDGVSVTLVGSNIDIEVQEPAFDVDDRVDIAYDADFLFSFQMSNTGLADGQTVRAYDTDGVERSNGTVNSDGTISFDSLPDGEPYQLTLVAEDPPEDDDDNGGTGGGGGGGSSGSSSDDSDTDSDGETDREVTEVTAVDSDDEDESDDADDSVDEDEVRSSSVSASISAGSTLSISLGLDDPTDVDEPDADDTEADDEVDDADDELEDDEIADDELADDEIEDDELADDELEDTDDAEDTDEPEVADSDIGERPPPTSQAEVESVEIDVNQDTDADIEIRQSRSPPSEDAREFERADGTQAAGYVQINNNLNPEAVDGGRINYRLNKDDLEADDADPEEVAMYHFNTETDEWEELETEVVGETDEHVRFRAETEGFSEFASGIKRAQFEVDDATVDVQEVTLGDTVRVEAIISNTGGADGTFRTELVVNEEVVEDDILTIASGGTRATLFDHEFLEADTYEVRVNDVSTGEITVLAPESTEPDETESFIPGFGIGAAVVSLLVASLAAWRRQEK